MSKMMGRPKKTDKKRMVCVYLYAREYDRLEKESEESGLPKSQIIERVLIKRNYQKYRKDE